MGIWKNTTFKKCSVFLCLTFVSFKDDDGGSLTDQLHFAKLPIIDNGECQELYNKYNEENKKKIKIIDEQVCAGHTEGKIDGCQVIQTRVSQPPNEDQWFSTAYSAYNFFKYSAK